MHVKINYMNHIEISLIKGIDLIKKEAYNNGALASYLSGAGPTIMMIVERLGCFTKSMEHF